MRSTSRKIFSTPRETAQAVLHRNLVQAALAYAFAILTTVLAHAADATDENEFVGLTLDELMNVQVTSVAGVERTLQSTPSAIYVITAEDIRRTGHQSIAEALRMVPGMYVGQINSWNWAISSRGFANRFGNKLLVLIDGRTVYTPLFSGVRWDIQDVVLEDIDRIEVIRGPGATLWGANAVNGVINIVTRSAKETQGWLLTGGAGTELHGFGAVRYGGKIGEDVFFRVFAKYHNHDDSARPNGSDSEDNWHMLHGGVRFDWLASDTDQLILEAGGHDGKLTEEAQQVSFFPPSITFPVGDSPVKGGHILARWERNSAPDAGMRVQAYYDQADRDVPWHYESVRTIDFDFRHFFPLTDSNDLIWGLGVRHVMDDTVGTPNLFFAPSSREATTYSAFVQNTAELVPNQVSLMFGSKFEHNNYTGFEVQPSARLTWTPDEDHALWGSISRAVRTPSRADDDVTINLGFVPPGLPLVYMGNRQFKSEELIAYEAGYRIQAADNLSFDLAAFYNDYDRLAGQTVSVVPPMTILLENANTGEAESYGFELSSKWIVADNWQLSAGYSFMRLHIHGDDDSLEGTSPQQMFNVRSYLNVTDDLEFNAAAYFVDETPGFAAGDYVRLDLGLTWRPTHNVEIAVWLQNLLDSQHLEATDTLFSLPAEIERSVYGQVTIRF
jgi:iron complex outermembrane receptor protein